MESKITAACIIIGDEILSGRTADKNLYFLANQLTMVGIQLQESRVILDNESEIMETVLSLKDKYNYIFTSGGIGPTHDDITTNSISKALNQEVITNPDAVIALEEYYGKEDLTESRLRMAMTPKDAILIPNSITNAPGYKIENIFVLAGIPKTFQTMFFATLPHLEKGIKILSRNVIIHKKESHMASFLGKLQKKYKEITIGSYPFSPSKKHKTYGTDIVFRHSDLNLITPAIEELILYLQKNKIKYDDNDKRNKSE